MPINYKRLDLLLQYIVAVAGQNDAYDRELGMIHLIKYVYLADIAYASRNDGETYTGLPWKFHHFGPWAVECYQRIEPALAAIGATQRTIESRELIAFKEKLNKDPEEKIKNNRLKSCLVPPRYDDVFFEGLAMLDNAAGDLPAEGKYVATFSPDIWKSKARHDPELS